VAGGLGEEQAPALFQGSSGFGEEVPGRGHLIDHREGHHAIHRTANVRKLNRSRRNRPGIDTLAEAGLRQPLSEPGEHPRLNFYRYDTARSHQASQRQREESHAGARLKYVIPSRTYGFTTSLGFSSRLPRGLTSRYPSHHGHTRCCFIGR
jgi:hypothetical protein